MPQSQQAEQREPQQESAWLTFPFTQNVTWKCSKLDGGDGGTALSTTAKSKQMPLEGPSLCQARECRSCLDPVVGQSDKVAARVRTGWGEGEEHQAVLQ